MPREEQEINYEYRNSDVFLYGCLRIHDCV